MRVWANETASTPIRVNLFSPGPIRTRMRATVSPGRPDDARYAGAGRGIHRPDVPPAWTETGKFYDYKTRTLMSFRAPA